MASSKIKGITIEIAGNTSKLQDALKDVDKQTKKTEGELKEVNKLLKFDPKNTELLAQKQTLLGKAIKDTSERLKTLKTAQEQMKNDGSVEENAEAYRELQREIIKTEQKLKSYSDQQDNVSKGTKDFDVSNKSLAKTLLENGANLGGLITTLKAVGNVISSVAKSISSIITSSTSFADDVNTLAKQYNLSTKEIQQYIRASDLIDVDINTIAKSMSKLTKNMTSTSSGVIGAFQKLGISTKDASGQLRDSNEVFNEVIEKLGQIENETLQDSLALEIFGKSSAELGSLINGGAEQLAEFNKYLEENNLILTQEELDSLNGLQDGFDTLKATIDSVKTKIGAELVPVIQPLVDDLIQYIVDNKDTIVEKVEEVVDYLTGEQGQKMFDDIGQSVKNIADMLLDLPQMREEFELLMVPVQALAKVIEVIAKIIHSIAWFFDDIKNVDTQKALQSFQGSGYIPYASGGFGALQSGGFKSDGITLNSNFVINNGSNISKSDVQSWAYQMADIINIELGRRI